MKQLISAGVIALIGVILVSPDVLLLIPALRSPHVDVNIGVITILLTLWSLLRDRSRSIGVVPPPNSSARPRSTVRVQTTPEEDDLSWIDEFFADEKPASVRAQVPHPTQIPRAPARSARGFSGILNVSMAVSAAFFFFQLFHGLV
ncbi:MAG: hypothetical protein EBS29_11165 [Chloroflexia bacterium]|nr:hypothetical protein [Chloroflexia bacterium]